MARRSDTNNSKHAGDVQKHWEAIDHGEGRRVIVQARAGYGVFS